MTVPESRTQFPAFPYVPYDIQLQLMTEMYDCLRQGQVGLFESPTGTGKSLSMFSCSLQWLIDQGGPAPKLDTRHQPQKQQLILQPKQSQPINTTQQGSFSSDDEDQFLPQYSPQTNFGRRQRPSSSDSESSDPECATMKAKSRWQRADRQPQKCQVIVCSRTHSQLAQLAGEIRKLNLPRQLRVQVIGSRKVLCCNPSVNKLGTAQDVTDKCMELQNNMVKKRNKSLLKRRKECSSRSCSYYAPSDEAINIVGDMLQDKVHDIEELVAMSSEKGVCPYYVSKAWLPDADVILAPYQLILSKEARESYNIDLNNRVVIFDEAHNLLSTLQQTFSAQITNVDLHYCNVICQTYLDSFSERLAPKTSTMVQQLQRACSRLKTFIESSLTKDNDSSQADTLADNGESSSTVFGVNDMLLESSLDGINIVQLVRYIKEQRLQHRMTGHYSHKMKQSQALNDPQNKFQLERKQQEQGQDGDSSNHQVKHMSHCINNFLNFFSALMSKDYHGKILISKQTQSKQCNQQAKQGNSQEQDGQPSTKDRDKQEKIFTINESDANHVNYTCKFVLLNASEKFSDLVSSARSIILLSGTLSPMNAVQAALFPSIPANKIRQFTCGHVVPPQNALTLTLGVGPARGCLDFRYKSKNTAQTCDEIGPLLLNFARVVPGGIVVFVASFQYLHTVHTHLQRNQFLDRIEAHKQVFIEPRSSGQVDGVLERYSNAIYSANARKAGQTGGLVLCVVGGKLSEGINFGDELGRCVVVLGLPYPNRTDAELGLHLQHADVQRKAGKGVCSSSELYKQMCMSAVNQCVGRVIRHRTDYACVVLVDVRYVQSIGSGSSPVKQLPQWMQGNVVSCGNFGQCIAKMGQFYRSLKGAG